MWIIFWVNKPQNAKRVKERARRMLEYEKLLTVNEKWSWITCFTESLYRNEKTKQNKKQVDVNGKYL